MPGVFGYEMGQSSCGDAFAWLSATTNRELASLSHGFRQRRRSPTSSPFADMDPHAVPLALDWLNGCRSPHNDPRLTSVIQGITMDTTPEDL